MDYWTKILETYSLEEILEYGGTTPEEALELLEKEGFLEDIPPLPVDMDNE